jgi:hypothetical protein
MSLAIDNLPIGQETMRHPQKEKLLCESVHS